MTTNSYRGWDNKKRERIDGFDLLKKEKQDLYQQKPNAISCNMNHLWSLYPYNIKQIKINHCHIYRDSI